jgi:hypothetical protein
VPGARVFSVAWTDQSGNFWLFGGQGEDSAETSGYLNDMWEYQPAVGSSTPVAATPTFSVAGGTYSTAQTVTLSDSTSGATIYYTTDGTTPTTSSSVYGTAINVSSTETLEAIAVASGFTNSAAATAAYTITQAAPGVSFAPTVVAFGNQTLNTTSSPSQVVVLSNTGTAPLAGIAVSITGASASAFGESSACGTTLAAGSSCNISVTFTPTAVGTNTASLSVTDNATGSPQTVALTGTGTVATVPSVTLSPTLLNFSAANGSTSAAQTVTLTNTGTVAVAITSVTLTGTGASSFAQTNTCGGSIVAGASCTASVTFTPAFDNAIFTAALSIADNATGSPQTVALNGTTNCYNNPATPNVNCNPGGTVVVTNSRTEQLTFAPPALTTANATAASTEIVGKYNGAIVYDQTFAAAYGTPTVQAGVTAANAAITAAGGPSAGIPAPSLTSSSTKTDTSSASTYSVAQPQATTTVVTTSSATTFGPGVLAVGGAPNSNPANPTGGQISMCTEASLPSSILPMCMPTNPGTFTVLAGQTDVNINTDSNYLIDTATTTTTTATTVAAYAINGTAATSAAVSLSPAGSLSFSATVGTTSAAQAVTITNSGTASLSFTGISLTGANAGSFAETNNCSAPLAVNANCTVSVMFSPGAAGGFTAAISIVDNATGSPQSVAITGTGTAPLVPQATLAPGSLTFPSTTVGAAATSMPITLANPGTATLAITSIGVTGANASSFGETNTCGASLAAGGSCIITVSFTPSSAGALAAAISVVDNATGSPQSVAVTGTGSAVVTGSATFTVASSTPTANVQPGGIAQFDLLIAPVGGSYTNVVSLSATGLPPGAQASFLPPSVTPGSAGTPSVLSIQTATGIAHLATPERPGHAPVPLLALLAGLPLLGFTVRVRRFRKATARWMLLALAALAILPALALSGCGGGYFGPAPKTYTVTVVGTSGSLQQSTTISLTVQ